MHSWLRQLILPVVVVCLACLAFEKRWLASMDYVLYDAVQPWLTPTEVTSSVVIAIDERSVAALGRWPWPRSVHAQLLERLAEHHHGNVFFDVLFVDPSTEHNDAYLAAAMARHGSVFLPMSIERLAQHQQPIELLPIAPLFNQAQGVGHVHLDCEYDGICRSFYQKVGLGRAGWPHLATLQPAPEITAKPESELTSGSNAQHTQHTQHKRLATQATSLFAIQRQGEYYLPFHPEDAVKVISYVDVLTGAVPLELIADQDLFIGATAPGIHDILATPVGRMPGVVITALLQHHWLHGGLIQLWHDDYLPWLLGAVFASLLFMFSLLPPRLFLAAMIGLIALQGAAMALLLGLFKLWLPLSAYLVATMLFYPLWSWLRLELTMRHLQRQLAEKPIHPLAPVLAQRLTAAATASTGAAALAKDPMAKTLLDVELATQTQFAAHELLERSFANLQEGCIIFDTALRCQLSNTLVGSWLPQWPGEDVFSLEQQLSLDSASWRDALQTLLSHDEMIELEVSERLQPDAQRRTFLLRAKRCLVQLPQLQPLQEQASQRQQPITLGVITLADVTALKRSEKQREETLNFVSHDLRSPLVSILALIKHWRETQPSNHLDTQLLGKVERYANRNLAYTESLLQLNRAEQLVVDESSMCDLLAVCEDAVAQLAPTAQEKQCPLKLRHGDDEFWVAGDYELLQRALVNLVANALKYAATAQGIEVSLACEGEQVLLSVRDYGPGLSAEQLANAFERFSRAPTHQEGAGLGLYFVKQVIERHKGEVLLTSGNSHQTAGSSHPKGCCITCSLPRHNLDFLP